MEKSLVLRLEIIKVYFLFFITFISCSSPMEIRKVKDMQEGRLLINSEITYVVDNNPYLSFELVLADDVELPKTSGFIYLHKNTFHIVPYEYFSNHDSSTFKNSVISIQLGEDFDCPFISSLGILKGNHIFIKKEKKNEEIIYTYRIRQNDYESVQYEFSTKRGFLKFTTVHHIHGKREYPIKDENFDSLFNIKMSSNNSNERQPELIKNMSRKYFYEKKDSVSNNTHRNIKSLCVSQNPIYIESVPCYEVWLNPLPDGDCNNSKINIGSRWGLIYTKKKDAYFVPISVFSIDTKSIREISMPIVLEKNEIGSSWEIDDLRFLLRGKAILNKKEYDEKDNANISSFGFEQTERCLYKGLSGFVFSDKDGFLEFDFGSYKLSTIK